MPLAFLHSRLLVLKLLEAFHEAIITLRLSTWFLSSRRFWRHRLFRHCDLFGTVAFCFELLDEEVCGLDTPVVRSVRSLHSESGKSDVSSSNKNASSLFAAIAVVGVNNYKHSVV